MIADAQAWGGTYDGFNIGAIGVAGSTSQGAAISNNLYYDGTNWRYITTGEGSVIFQSSGTIALYTAASGSAGAVASLNNAKLLIDTDGSVTLKTAAGLGYGAGSGGTVTQATSKSTAVTLNKPVGQITMNGAALAAGSAVQFTFNNSLISATDSIVLTIYRAGIASSANYNVWGDVGAGSSLITLRNISGGSLSEAVILNFALIKGAIA